MTLMDLARAIEARDPYSSGHAARVTAIAEVIAARLGWDDEQIGVLRIGALLHDIGKLDVPDSVLRKPGRSTKPSSITFASIPRMARACSTSCRGGVRRCRASSTTTSAGTDMGIRPAGAGEDIPIEARILAVADAYDAMTSDRPYRRALSQVRAISELERCAGTQFDPDVVAVFAEAWRQGGFELPTGIPRAAASLCPCGRPNR